MAPMSPPSDDFSSSGNIPRANEDFHATPVAAVVVPIVLIILLLLAAVLLLLYFYWRRRNDRERLIAAAAPKAHRKLLPAWLSDWMGGAHVRPLQRPQSRVGSSVDLNLDTLKADSVDGDSDAIALRSVTVPLPPRRTYDPHDREASVRPKKLGTPVLFG